MILKQLSSYCFCLVISIFCCTFITHSYDCVKPFAFFFGSNFIFLCFWYAIYDNNLKQSKTKFELRITLNDNLSNKKYNSVNWKISKVPVIMVKPLFTLIWNVYTVSFHARRES